VERQQRRRRPSQEQQEQQEQKGQEQAREVSELPSWIDGMVADAVGGLKGELLAMVSGGGGGDDDDARYASRSSISSVPE
jgi:hypothetical protein